MFSIRAKTPYQIRTLIDDLQEINCRSTLLITAVKKKKSLNPFASYWPAVSNSPMTLQLLILSRVTAYKFTVAGTVFH